MRINHEDVDILRITHNGNGFQMENNLMPSSWFDKPLESQKRVFIEFNDTNEIEQMIYALHEFNKQCSANWNRMEVVE